MAVLFFLPFFPSCVKIVALFFNEMEDSMQYIVFAAFAFAFLVGKGIYDKKKAKENIKYTLKKAWGAVPQETYLPEKFYSLQSYYKKVKKEAADVDSITWNDLAMDEIYMRMNHTVSSVGEEYLYAMLHQLVFDEAELKERERLISFFQKNETARYIVQEALYGIGKHQKIALYEYMSRIKDVPRETNLLHYICAAGIAGSVLLCFLMPPIGIVLTFGFIFFNLYRYIKRKQEIEPYYHVMISVIRLLKSCEVLEAANIEEISEYTKQLTQMQQHFASFKKGFRLITSAKPTGDLADMVLDYVRMLFHVDLIKFNNMLDTFDTYETELERIYTVIGFLDSMLAVASFRTLYPSYSVPVLKNEKQPYLKLKEVFHPLIDNPVTNTIETTQSVLVTGSNASGKSTFLKAVALNAILSQTVHTAIAAEYKASYFKVASSMALQDDILKKESYYIVEIKSLKRILDGITEEIPTLVFVDEVLRGTNTVERIAASSRVLHSLAGQNTLCFAATHDIELTHMLERRYDNYHFEEQVTGNEVTFDYILHHGRAVSRNAIRLLGMLGYPKTIIEQAEQAAKQFVETGEWLKIK